MWPAFTEGYENIVANVSSKASKATVKGLLKKFQSFKFLTLACTYLDLLEKMKECSKTFEGVGLRPQEVKPALDISLSDLQECIDNVGNDEEFLQSNLSRFQIHTDEGRLLVKAEYTKEGHTVKAPSQREYITYTFKNLGQLKHNRKLAKQNGRWQ